MPAAGSIFVDLILRDSNYQQGFARARRLTSSSANVISNDINTIGVQFKNLLNPVNALSTALRNFAAISGTAFSVQGIVRYSDTFKQLQGRLSIVETDARKLAVVQEQLFEIAQRNRSPLEAVVNFYQRLNQFIPESVRSQYDLLGVTENVTAALAITGETSISANNALIQFTQAIGTNFEAAGQELRTLQEQAPRLAQALQNALGGGTKSLQTLKAEGLLTRDSVLRALAGMGTEGRKLAEELKKIPVTVGQAFIRLDNALLQFIGKSQTVGSITGNLSYAITELAENIDILANGVTTISIVLGVRYVSALAAANVSTLVYGLNVVRLNVLLASFASTSVLATGSTLALAAATKVLSAAMNLIVPLAAIALLYEVVDGNESLIASEQELKKAVSDTSEKLDENFKKHGRLTEEAKSQVNERIEAYRREIEALDKVLQAQLDNRTKIGLLGRGVKDFAGETVIEGLFGKDYQSLEEVIKKQQNYNQTIVELNALLEKNRKAPLKLDIPVGGGKNAEKQQDRLNRLTEKYKTILTGLDAETLKYIESFNELAELKRLSGATDEKLIEWQQRLREEFEKTNKKNEEMTVFAKRAAENVQDAFADFLFDPFKEGLDGMARNFVDTMRRMIAEAAAAKLAKRLFGDLIEGGSGSGVFGSSLGSIFDGFFADGGYVQPGHFGIAGEAGAELLYGGKTGVTVMPVTSGNGGNTYNIDARGADQGAVARIETALIALAGPGAIERRVINAQRRGTIA